MVDARGQRPLFALVVGCCDSLSKPSRSGGTEDADISSPPITCGSVQGTFSFDRSLILCPRLSRLPVSQELNGPTRSTGCGKGAGCFFHALSLEVPTSTSRQAQGHSAPSRSSRRFGQRGAYGRGTLTVVRWSCRHSSCHKLDLSTIGGLARGSHRCSIDFTNSVIYEPKGLLYGVLVDTRYGVHVIETVGGGGGNMSVSNALKLQRSEIVHNTMVR